jgi:plastocyanin
MHRRGAAAAAVFLLAACSQAPSTTTKEEKAPPVYFKPDPASAGRIAGKVTLAGRKPARRRITVDDDECNKTRNAPLFAEDVVVGDHGGLANVLVHVKAGLNGKTFEPPASAVRFDQKGCSFQPHVIALRTGQHLEITNSDQVTHNIHPMPRENREWNQGQPSGSEPIQREFRKSETGIPVKCNVHAWMRSYIHVIDHPYFAVSAPDGSFELTNLPPGEYTLEAWHEKLGQQTATVTVKAAGAAAADFSFKGE